MGGRLGAGAVVNYAIAVDVRNRLCPPLPKDHFGNAVVHTLAMADVSEMTNDQFTISIPTIAIAAVHIRQSVAGVDDPYVRKRIALFAFIGDPTAISAAFRRALDMPHTGLEFSDWRERGADLEFAIPGTSSSIPEWARET